MEKKIKIKSELSELYDFFNEDQRLTSKAGRIEFYTTVAHIEKHLKPDMKILDIGAGTGAYSLYLAEKGYDVTAVELVKKHVDIIKSKVTDKMKIKVHEGNALDLSMVKNESFDIILCFGPLYHLADYKDRQQVIHEIKTLSHKDTTVFYAFISNDMVIATETMCYNPDFFKGSSYNKETFTLKNQPFVFHKVEDCRSLLTSCDINILHEIGADGLSELCAEKINKMDDETYESWFKYHLYCSEKPEFLGMSNHYLFVGKHK